MQQLAAPRLPGHGRDVDHPAVVGGVGIGVERADDLQAGLDPAVVHVGEVGLHHHRGEVRQGRHRHAGPDGVPHLVFAALEGVGAHQHHAVARGLDGERVDRLFRGMDLPPRLVERDPLHLDVGVAHLRLAAEHLLGLGEVGLGALEGELALLVFAQREEVLGDGGVDLGLLQALKPRSELYIQLVGCCCAAHRKRGEPCFQLDEQLFLCPSWPFESLAQLPA